MFQTDSTCADNNQPRRSGRLYPVLLSAAFFGAGLFIADHHEMWRDETQAWLLARDSRSPFELFRNLKYEGHPALWHLCLMGLDRMGLPPEAMQVFHLAIATGAVYVVARFSPFSRLQCALFAFGYYSFFEYSVVCRNYSLAVFLAAILCATFPRRAEKCLSMAAVLFLLCHTCVHGAIIAVVISAVLLVEHRLKRGDDHAQPEAGRLRRRIAFAIVALGIVSSGLQMLPAPDSGFSNEWHMSFDPGRARAAMCSVTRAYIPVPRPDLDFWNSHIVELLADKSQSEREQLYESIRIQAGIGCWLLIGSVILVARQRMALLVHLALTGSLLVFGYVKISSGMRHDGFLFLSFLMSLWVGCGPGCFQRQASGESELLRSVRYRRLLNYSLTSLLFVHVIGGAIAVATDYQHPFSQAKAAARYIEVNELHTLPMVCEPDYSALSVIGYLPDTQAFFLRGERFGTFVIWDKTRVAKYLNEDWIDDRRIVRRAAELGADVLLVMNRPLNQQVISVHQLEALTQFTGSIAPLEDIYLYRLRRQQGSPDQE